MCDPEGRIFLKGDVEIIDVEKIRDGLSKLAETQNLQIVEGHYADIIPQDYLIHCYILDPDIEVLRPRLIEREYPIQKIDENIEAHIMQECYQDALEYYNFEQITVLSGTHLEDDLEVILTKIKSIE